MQGGMYGTFNRIRKSLLDTLYYTHIISSKDCLWKPPGGIEFASRSYPPVGIGGMKKVHFSKIHKNIKETSFI
jgi:hypothetical protein